MRIASKINALAALLLIASTIIVAVPNKVFAASGNPSYCDSDVPALTNQNIGTEVPVILVHGFNGNTQEWGSINNASSFAGRINNIPGVAVAHIFSYSTLVWVNDPGSGPRLAKTIDCVSQLSLHNGGKGKVIVVGYSMGGLVARDAGGHMSSDGQRDISNEIGQAITIGTPHTGTNLPNIGIPLSVWRGFIKGSAELATLPHFYANTVVHSIAGDVTRVHYDIWNKESSRETPHDDTLVPVDSALAEATSDASKGGGTKVVYCEKGYNFLGFARDQNVSCEHAQLTNNATNGVREDTIDAIKKYVASLETPAGVSLKVGNLTTTYDNRWIHADYGASGPGYDALADDTTNSAQCTNCSDTPPPTFNAFIQITNYADWCQGDALDCMTDPADRVGTAPAVTIGGRTPDVSARYLDSGYQGTSLVWCVTSEKVCVQYRRGTDAPQLEPSQALIDVLNTATWSD